jgi:hypothetical protein
MRLRGVVEDSATLGRPICPQYVDFPPSRGRQLANEGGVRTPTSLRRELHGPCPAGLP